MKLPGLADVSIWTRQRNLTDLRVVVGTSGISSYQENTWILPKSGTELFLQNALQWKREQEANRKRVAEQITDTESEAWSTFDEEACNCNDIVGEHWINSHLHSYV